jgi:hypothetical protein
MAIHTLRQLPSGMVLIDNQGGNMRRQNDPRLLSPRESVALLSSASSAYNRSPAEAIRIAMRADGMGESVVEHMSRSRDHISREHEREHVKAAKVDSKVDSKVVSH